MDSVGARHPRYGVVDRARRRRSPFGLDGPRYCHSAPLVPGLWRLDFADRPGRRDAGVERVGIPSELQATVAGESLFNDGIGVVLFSLLVSLALNSAAQLQGPFAIASLFLLQAVGGGLLGLALGYAAFVLLRGVDDYSVELIISLALVTVTYSLAGSLQVSGPVAVVVAGILIGNHGMQRAMSEATRRHLETFWLGVCRNCHS